MLAVSTREIDRMSTVSWDTGNTTTNSPYPLSVCRKEASTLEIFSLNEDTSAVTEMDFSIFKSNPTTDLTVANLWLSGTVMFSGSIYGLCLGGPRLLGPVTPLGGVLMMAGWATLFFGTEGTVKPSAN